MSKAPRGDQEEGEAVMGSGQSQAEARSAVSEMDAIRQVAEALDRIADAITLLARATAGEFDDSPGDAPAQVDLAGNPIR